ncbi:SHOCT domain-containing protein [Perlabentimonas gracilis]|uniref:SHOCT domain-containing protein n=1 Tax=Perlabentimonas gracilis TaxID=2715279 RepID=UPI00140E4023|nr:SHOCT domain-containing protein [Perlabentimonas gracilis]NHB69905.1 SHOCT domain-containing protein [Perlabentimonas gracilis]
MEYQTILILGIITLVIFFVLREQYRSRKRAQLRNAYRNALKNGNKTKALAIGRRYYSYLRNGKLSIYDEQAINNDINTITEGSKNNFTHIDQLEKLSNLKEKGVITEEEFLLEKAKLINR